jgi:hypothetical protein
MRLMTWIRTVPPEQAAGRLREVYEKLYGMYPPEYFDPVPAVIRADGSTDSVMAAHSLLPEVMEATFATHALLLRPELPLSRRQHEMIAALVSALNHCVY